MSGGETIRSIVDGDTIEKILLQYAADKKLSDIVVSEDGLLTVSTGTTNDDGCKMILQGRVKLHAEWEGKSCDYTCASIYLQIVDPDQGLLAYRNACKNYNVQDPVKASDKKIIVSYFLGTSSADIAESAPPPSAAASAVVAAQDSTSIEPKHAEDSDRKSKDKDRHHDKDERERRRQHEQQHKDRDRGSRDKDKRHRDDRKQESASSLKHKDRDRNQRHADGESPGKKQKAKKDYTVTNEQLMEHLDVVVDKRKLDPDMIDRTGIEEDHNSEKLLIHDEESLALKRQHEEIRKALSADGFHLIQGTIGGSIAETDENTSTANKKTVILPEHKERTAAILSNEIPVGNSASILRANNPRKDLTRALELYMETVTPASGSAANHKKGNTSVTATNSKPATSGSKGGAPRKVYLFGKRPVIVVPKGMTAPITMINAHEFLCSGKFVPRDVMFKQNQAAKQQLSGTKSSPPTTFTRQIQGIIGPSAGAPGFGGNLLEYEITDNPRKLLGPDPKEWERIVAVIVLGQSWQFKDWHKMYSIPATLFDNVYGFYLCMEGDKEPPEVAGWAVHRSYLNRDKRGLDSVSLASFWNGLDEWMRVYKPELLPQNTGATGIGGDQ